MVGEADELYSEMSKEEIVDTFITLLERAATILKELGALIEKAESGAEADEIYTMIVEKLGDKIADKIWDDLVDWDKVTWNE